MDRNRTITHHVKPSQHKVLQYPDWYTSVRVRMIKDKHCLWCGSDVIGKSVVCSDQCKEFFLAWMPSANTYRNVKSLPRWIHLRDGFVCKKCLFIFCVLAPSGLQIPQFWGQTDHIRALINGGEDAIKNLQLICDPCHKRKTLEDMKYWNKHKHEPF